jgi:co-chaperonin GroES (HSP10)
MNPLAIKPSRERMLVQHITDDERNDGGIIIPQSATRNHCKGRVIAIGSDVDLSFDGALVLIPNYSKPDIIHESFKYTFCKEHDIIAILDETAELYALPIV